MITAVGLVNTSITPHNYHSFLWGEYLRTTYSLSNLQAYHTVPLTRAPRCTFGSQNVFILSLKLYPLPNISARPPGPGPPPPAPRNHQSTLFL